MAPTLKFFGTHFCSLIHLETTKFKRLILFVTSPTTSLSTPKPAHQFLLGLR